MAEKTGYQKFQNTLLIYAVVWIVAIIVQLVIGLSAVVWMPAIFASFFAIGLRLHIVRLHNISECGANPCSNALGEVCCGFWCWYCSVAQMARHLYGYTKVLDGDADIHRPDNYQRV